MCLFLSWLSLQRHEGMALTIPNQTCRVVSATPRVPHEDVGVVRRIARMFVRIFVRGFRAVGV